MSKADSFDSLMQKLKVAVAVGCVRSKPEGVTGKEYAQQLCDEFQRSQLEWKQRYERAETEILHLQQQLAMKQTSSVEQMAHDNHGSESELFPTPPSSGSHGNQTVPECSPFDNASHSLSRHTVFLHHVISLQTGSNLLPKSELDLVVKKSIEHSLDVIKEHVGDTNISNKLQIQCIQSIDKLYSNCDNQLKQKILENVRISAEKIISRITSQEQNRSQQQFKLTELLQELSWCKAINIPVIEQLTESILTFSDHLRTVTRETSKGELLDPYYFCNIYHIIKILDQCLEVTEKGSLLGELRDKIQTKLEDSLLHLTDKFPLFAHAVWRLTTKINT